MAAGTAASVSICPAFLDGLNRAHVLSLALVNETGDRFEWPIAWLLDMVDTAIATSNSSLIDIIGSADRLVCLNDPMYLNFKCLMSK